MLISFGLILLLGILVDLIFNKIKIPSFIGMLAVGILIGPYGLGWLSPDLTAISQDLRNLSLIIILLQAGLGLNKDALKQVGGSAIKFSFIPGLVEGFVIAGTAMLFLDFSFFEGGMLGFIIAAVSPAVVVPLMLKLAKKGYGTDKGIPTLILAGSSVDDVFAITLFTSFLGLHTGKQLNLALQILGIPVSILLGIGLGIAAGLTLSFAFKLLNINNTKKVLIIISLAILLVAIQNWLKGVVEIAALLGVMTMGFVLLIRKPELSQKLSKKFQKIWVLAEIFLFILVGAEVNISVVFHVGLVGILIILIGLIGRSIGVILATLGANFSWREQVFCMIAYMPKATVQAAVGAIPLSLGLESGEVILAIAVIAILITAPFGSIAIEKSAPILLAKDEG